MMRSRSLFRTSVCCVSARPISHGTPADWIELKGDAPVPPSKPEISTWSAFALATPAAFAGLGALRHFDLQLVGVDEVVDVDAEAPGGDLLDRRAARVAVLVGRVADRVLAALAGVRLAADAVHRDRQRLVRLARERAEAHRAGDEALDDLARRLDVVD